MASTETPSFRVTFPGTDRPPVDLPVGANLAESLSVDNSPLLFGCRTGICGTCIIKVESGGHLPDPEVDEREILDVMAEGETCVRLACQLRPRGDIAVRRYE